ncbi:MAG: hypothetical protein JXB10_02655 [Pirellulales bacterium]|nr:hypothetical protein [Pirellulales bacterium]
MKNETCISYCVLAGVCCLFLMGCQCNPFRHGCVQGPAYDRPFPLGQVTDAHWDTQQTNAEASDFVFYDHEFVGDTSQLTPLGEKHLYQVAWRLEHVPFPVVIEESVDNKKPAVDAERRRAIVNQLTQLGLCVADQRVVVAPAIAEGITAIEGEAEYYQIIGGSNMLTGTGYLAGRGFGGFGGVRR